MLATHTVDLSPLPPAERFDHWADLVAKEIAPNQISSTHAHDFDVWMRMSSLGALTLTTLRFPSLTTRRTAKLIRRSDPQQYHLALLTSGSGTVEQDRSESAIQPGHFTLLTSSRPYEASHGIQAVAPEPVASIVVVIPHSQLPIPHDKVSRLFGMPLPSAGGMGILLARHLRQISAHPEQYDTSDAPLLAGIALNLITAMLAQQLNVAGSLSRNVQQVVLRTRIDAFIDANLDRPDLGPQMVAAAHNVSMTTLKRLFLAGEAPVAEVIRTRRLQRCQKDLADPALRDRPVHAIASRWGFRSVAHFSRIFREKYGVSPSEYRVRN
ncbi:helix-turn-helix domain-containing protein [Dactylosporangium sp. NPDC005555]|uniref:AraC-like ligand-binding domain-containing protein n=1 Tax=Dactylosporangium sp. NPDC005555 TaxID=3154889 RepID=UPI0033AB1014